MYDNLQYFDLEGSITFEISSHLFSRFYCSFVNVPI